MCCLSTESAPARTIKGSKSHVQSTKKGLRVESVANEYVSTNAVFSSVDVYEHVWNKIKYVWIKSNLTSAKRG